MYAAGMPFNGDTIPKGESLGGSESSAYYLGKELSSLGHNVRIFTCIQPDQQGFFDGVEYLGIGNMTEENNLGEAFTRFAQGVPTDVLYMQRHPQAFKNLYKSKMNIWATHDLALKRNLPQINGQLWNVDFVTSVSEWHRQQLIDVYDLNHDNVKVVENGIDPSLYKESIDLNAKFKSKNLIFTSRPERGLMPLVKEGGIMEKLFAIDPNIKLFVTFYTLMDGPHKQAYAYMLDRCKKLPNVNLLSPMGKQELATLEENCALYVYPTLFEDTSCITAMSSQQNSTPFISYKTGALPETLEGGGNVFIDRKYSIQDEHSVQNNLEFGPEDERGINAFCDTVLELLGDKEKYLKLANKCYKNKYTWEMAARSLEFEIEEGFKAKTKDKEKLYKHLLKYSDVDTVKIDLGLEDRKDYKNERDYLKKHFSFTDNEKAYSEKYKESYDVSVKENRYHGLGNTLAQLLERVPRVNEVVNELRLLKPGSVVLDYGSSMGQQTTCFAKEFPNLYFIGVEIDEQARNIAIKFSVKAGLSNIDFDPIDHEFKIKFDFINCGEVLEHVIDYEKLCNHLESLLSEDGRVLFSVPSNLEEGGEKQHVRHFEKSVIHEIFKDKRGYKWSCRDQGIWENMAFSYQKCNKKINPWPQDYKMLVQNPEHTISVCMIMTNDVGIIGKTLQTVSVFADEIIIAVDASKGEIKPELKALLDSHNVNYYEAKSPTEIGFDKARNQTIEKAKSDWIMWIDSDEFVVNPHNVKKMLRDNQYHSLAVAQTHFSSEPVGCIKTDYPNRIFRNHRGVKFFGVVHEHPEVKMNEGIGKTFMIPISAFSITHFGYENEAVRRKRFERNLPLMVRDRELNPERELGSFLWMRDLCHLNRFQLERGEQLNNDSLQRCREVVGIFMNFIEKKKIKVVKDGIQYFNEAVSVLTNKTPLEIRFSFDANYGNIGDNKNNKTEVLSVCFQNKEQINKFVECMTQEKLNYFDSKYL